MFRRNTAKTRMEQFFFRLSGSQPKFKDVNVALC